MERDTLEWLAYTARARLGHHPEVISYLAGRGVTHQDIEHWCIGYWDRSSKWPQLEGRLLFPIFSHSGETVVSISGRQMGGREPKYWHTSFEKSHWLYGLWQQPISQPILVEGMMDAIALRRLGYFALATMGTALTQMQAALLALYSDWCVILPHNDAWAVAAKWRKTLQSVGIWSLVPMALYPGDAPQDADPDWLCQVDRGLLVRTVEGLLAGGRWKFESSPLTDLRRSLEGR